MTPAQFAAQVATDQATLASAQATQGTTGTTLSAALSQLLTDVQMAQPASPTS
jgi:hypothetical protein